MATSDTWFGPAIEREWSPFNAKIILRSKATALPIYFPGQNSRLYQIADKLSATMRQGLLLHEVVHAMEKTQAPVVGEPIARDMIDKWSKELRQFMAWLRETTLALKQDP